MIDRSRALIDVLAAAATAMPWPPDRIEERLVAWAEKAVRASVTVEDAASPSPALSVFFSENRFLVARRADDAAPLADLERRLLIALTTMATTSARYANREARLRRQALTDDLTGLWSHGTFPELLAATSRQREPDERLGVLFLDLDKFKQINEDLGHLDADAVLREIGNRLVACLPPDSVVGRVGGDEFACVVRRVRDDRDLAVTVAALRAAVKAPIPIGEQLLRVDVSIGAALSETPGDDPDALLRRAETGMRTTKHSRSAADTPRLYDERTVMRELLDQGRIQVALQPIVLLDTGRVVGYEALVRADHLVVGPLAPLLLVSAASRLRLLDELTGLVADQAVAAVAEVSRRTGAPLWLSINVEFEQLVPGGALVTTLPAKVEGTDVRLVLEISERLVGRWTPSHDVFARELAQAGIGLAIDNFGGGYSSFAMLHSWSWRWVKVDQELVSARDDDQSRTLLGHVVRMLGDLDLDVVAEGVESEEQRALLHGWGVRLGQGRLLCAPQPVGAVLSSVDEHGLALPTDD